MGCYITSDNKYYEGDKAHWQDILIPKRPDYTYKWDGKAWLIDAVIVAEAQAQQAKVNARADAIANTLPSWTTVKAGIDTAFPDAKQNKIITGLARITYWLAKDSAE